ncbi:MAG: hypothetical protein ACRCS8_02385 [Brevinema sp.]
MLLFRKTLMLLCLFPVFSFANANDKIRDNIKEYFTEWISQKHNNWAFEIDGVQFSPEGLEYGLKAVSSNVANLPKSEQQQIKDAFIQTFIDQNTILINSYKDLLEHENFDLLIQEFFRQAATQLWLEKELAKNPKAIEPTKKEIDTFFQENSEILLKRGLSASQIMEYSTQQLKQRKIQEWTQAKIKELRDSSNVKVNPKLKK